MKGYNENTRAHFRQRYTARSLRRLAAQGDTMIVVARTADTLVGVGFCSKGQIFGMYVDPEWQRQGVGGLVLARLEALLVAEQNRGAHEAIVEAGVGATAFYEKHGYRSIRESKFKSEPFFPYLVMKKTLCGEGACPPATHDFESKPSDAILAVQLSELNQRVRMHAGRLWQLPFAYVGVVALFLSEVGDLQASPTLRVASGFLLLLGIVVIWCMLGAYEGVARGGGEIAKVEAAASLQQTASLAPDRLERLVTGQFVGRLTWHFLPYLALAVVGAAAVLVTFIVLRCAA